MLYGDSRSIHELLPLLVEKQKNGAIVFLLSLAFLCIISVKTAGATVLEYDDNGAVVTNGKKQEPSQKATRPAKKKEESSEIIRPRTLGPVTGDALKYRQMAQETGLKYSGSDGVITAGLDALTFTDVFVSLIHVESAFDPLARSHKGAVGLGQIMPDTASDYGLNDLENPHENLRVAAEYLTNLLQRFGSLELALAAYNAGPSNVEKYGDIPPFKETHQYIADIFKAADIEAGDKIIKIKNPPKFNQSPKQVETETGDKSVWEF